LKRREFITLLGGAAAAWPLAARTQQSDRVRRIGVLMATAADEDQEAGLGAFLQALKQLGWVEGRNVQQIAPGLVRVAVFRDAELTAGIGQFAVIQSVASALGVEVSAINMPDAGEIERAVDSFTQSPNGGLILTTSAKAVVHRDLIIALAARYKLPMITYRRYYVARGALISYGYNFIEQFELAAGYVDRILKGAKPAELPVQAPTKYELAINLKTAKALGLAVPLSLLAIADEVIE